MLLQPTDYTVFFSCWHFPLRALTTSYSLIYFGCARWPKRFVHVRVQRRVPCWGARSHQSAHPAIFHHNKSSTNVRVEWHFYSDEMIRKMPDLQAHVRRCGNKFHASMMYNLSGGTRLIHTRPRLRLILHMPATLVSLLLFREKGRRSR